MITPVYHEVPESLVFQVKKAFPHALVACDPQGWCRVKKPGTDEIIIKQWIPTDKLLQSVSIVKISSEELIVSSNHDLKGFISSVLDNNVILVITGGAKGNWCFQPTGSDQSKKCFFTPIIPINNIIDSTGAGDVWLTSFTAKFHITKNIVPSLAFAAVLTSLKVQAEGTDFKFISQEALEELIKQHELKIKILSLDQGLAEISSFY